jgi:hypothetical protein
MHRFLTTPAQHACFLEIWLYFFTLFIIIRAVAWALSVLLTPTPTGAPRAEKTDGGRHRDDDRNHHDPDQMLLRRMLTIAYWELLANKARALYYTKRALQHQQVPRRTAAASPASTGKLALRKRWVSMDDMWARSTGR